MKILRSNFKEMRERVIISFSCNDITYVRKYTVLFCKSTTIFLRIFTILAFENFEIYISIHFTGSTMGEKNYVMKFYK